MGFYSSLKQSKGRIVSPYLKRASEAELLESTKGVNTNDEDINIANNQLSNAENYLITSKGKLDKAQGHTLYGNFIGTATGILWGGNFLNRTNVQEQLAAYHTGMYRYVASTWTALTGVAFTTNKPGDGAFFPSTNKFYYVNETDNVVKYTSGASADQTDAAFIKGGLIEEFQNRLLVAKDDVVWYTDLAVDTFGANNYFRTRGKVIGMRGLYDVYLTFTKNKISRLQNFIFDGNIAGPESLVDLPTPFGTICDRTIVVGNNRIYFLGQDLDNRCHIYETDGYQVKIVSEDIAPTLNNLSASQLQYACAGFDGRNYRLSVAEDAQTSNNLEIVYDTTMNIFQPFRRKRVAGTADYSIYWASETSGQWDLYAGSQGTGQVFKLDQADYEECAEERHIVAGTNIAIDANPAVRAAQSFKLSGYNAARTVNLSSLYLLLRKVSGTTTELTVRIETDTAGAPSGTLADVDATATITALSSTTFAWTKVSMASVSLLGNTTYWIVVKHTTEGSGDSKYFWSGDACSPSYTNGNLSNYASSAWTADLDTDANFALYSQSAIDGFADFKAFMPAGAGYTAKLQKFMAMFSTSGSYSVEVGFAVDGLDPVIYLVDLTGTTSALWDNGVLWDNGELWDAGSSTVKNFAWVSVNDIKGKTIKPRIRSRNANEPHTFNGFRLVFNSNKKQQ